MHECIFILCKQTNKSSQPMCDSIASEVTYMGRLYFLLLNVVVGSILNI